MSVWQRTRRAGWAVVSLLATLFALNGISALQSCHRLRPVHEGEIAPEFAMPRIDSEGHLGAQFSLSQTRGSIVILDFWATWCGPCKASMPVLEGMAKEYAGQGLVILSINTEGRSMTRQARQMVNRLAPTVELLSDQGQAASLYKVNTIPHMLILDRNGTVVWVHRGMGSAAGLRSDLNQAIEALL